MLYILYINYLYNNMCCNEYKDNRESCGEVISSSCVPYVGYIHDELSNEFKCKPNINDILKKVQELIFETKEYLGDNSKLKLSCLEDSLEEGFSQEEFNQVLIKELCELKKVLGDGNIDPDNIKLAISLLCLQDPSCDPKQEYTIKELFTKLIAGYCNLLSRVKNIENILNI